MELKKLHVNPTEKGCDGKKTLSITASSTFSFNRSAKDHLKFIPGAKIDFFQDIENLNNWYILIDKEAQTEVRIRKDGRCRFISKEIRKSILSSLNLGHVNIVRFEIKDEILFKEKWYYPMVLIQ